MKQSVEKNKAMSVAVRNVLGGALCLDEAQDLPCLVLPQHLLVDSVRKLHDDPETGFTQLTDLFGVDYPAQEKRFEIIYHLLSVHHNWRIRLKIRVSEDEKPTTLCSVFSAANWFEREVWDMFGVAFDQHPNMQRILTDYDFEGYPLRRDFPVFGKVELSYDSEQQKLVYQPTRLTQPNRLYDFQGARKDRS